MAVTMSSYTSTTLIVEDTDLLVLMLYHAATNDGNDLYFRSDKDKPNVYNITVLKRLLGDDVSSDLCSSIYCQDAIPLREYSGWERNL